MNMVLERMAVAMVGGEAAWAGMSPEMQRMWLETTRRGVEVVAERITALEQRINTLQVERDRFHLVLRQIGDPRQGDREFTAQGLAAVARTALRED